MPGYIKRSITVPADLQLTITELAESEGVTVSAVISRFARGLQSLGSLSFLPIWLPIGTRNTGMILEIGGRIYVYYKSQDRNDWVPWANYTTAYFTEHYGFLGGMWRPLGEYGADLRDIAGLANGL